MLRFAAASASVLVRLVFLLKARNALQQRKLNVKKSLREINSTGAFRFLHVLIGLQADALQSQLVLLEDFAVFSNTHKAEVPGT